MLDWTNNMVQFWLKNIVICEFKSLSKISSHNACFIVYNYYTTNEVSILEVDTNVPSRNIKCDNNHALRK